MKQNNKKFKSFRQIHNKWLKNKGYKQAYQELGLEFSLISALVERRTRRGLTQEQLAKKVGAHQSAIARFESGSYNPSLAFAQKLAHAMNSKIKLV